MRKFHLQAHKKRICFVGDIKKMQKNKNLLKVSKFELFRISHRRLSPLSSNFT